LFSPLRHCCRMVGSDGHAQWTRPTILGCSDTGKVLHENTESSKRTPDCHTSSVPCDSTSRLSRDYASGSRRGTSSYELDRADVGYCDCVFVTSLSYWRGREDVEREIWTRVPDLCRQDVQVGSLCVLGCGSRLCMLPMRPRVKRSRAGSRGVLPRHCARRRTQLRWRFHFSRLPVVALLSRWA
jgi:hypothetical protein